MEIIEVEENPYAQEDTDDLAMQYQRVLQDLEELNEIKSYIQEELANRALDKEDQTLKTAYGDWKAEYRGASYAHRKDDQKALARDVMGAIIEEIDLGDKGWEVLDILEDIFTLQGKKGQLKVGEKGRTTLLGYDFPVKKYFHQTKSPYYAIKRVDK